MSNDFVHANTDADVVRVFIVRHGQTSWNAQRRLQGHQNISLNSEGEEQARRLAWHLQEKGIPFDRIVCSDLDRCVQTLRPLQHDAPVTYTSGLRERFMGEVEGMYIEDARAKFGPDFHNRGETKDEMLARVIHVWNNHVVVPGEAKNVLVCTHGGVIRNLMGWLDPSHEGSPYNTSISVVDVSVSRDSLQQEVAIRGFGSTVHLGEERTVALEDRDLR